MPVGKQTDMQARTQTLTDHIINKRAPPDLQRKPREQQLELLSILHKDKDATCKPHHPILDLQSNPISSLHI